MFAQIFISDEGLVRGNARKIASSAPLNVSADGYL